jgi:hypothetical protein
VQVSIAWLKDCPEAYQAGHMYGPDGHTYQALCKLWAREEFIAKYIKARECRGTGRQPGHTYGPDGHIRMGQRTVRKIVTKMYSHFIFSY